MNATILLVAWTISSTTIPQFYQEYGGIYPTGRTVHVCGGAGCAWKVKFKFTVGDLTVLKGLLSASRTASQERKAIANTVAWSERRTCSTSGLCSNPGGSGGLTDCTDEAANVSSFLLVMQPYLRFHRVIPPLHRMKLFSWPHWAGRIQDSTGRRWIVDSYFKPNGRRPIITREEQWLR